MPHPRLTAFAHAARLAAVTLCLALPNIAVAEPKESIFTRPVDDRFSHGAFDWSMHMGGFDFAWSVILHEGEIAVCGIFTSHNQRMHDSNRTALQKGFVEHNNKRILKSLSYFAFAGFDKDLKSAKVAANCKTTGHAPGGKGYQLKFPPLRVRL